MTFFGLLGDLSHRNIRLETDGAAIYCEAPEASLTPEAVESLKRFKPQLIWWLSLGWLSPDAKCPPPSDFQPCVSDEDNERNWSIIDSRDRDYLTGPRNWPKACPWCGGRLRHGPDCMALDDAIIPNGKHAGRSVYDLPPRLLSWVIQHPARWPAELLTEARRAKAASSERQQRRLPLRVRQPRDDQRDPKLQPRGNAATSPAHDRLPPRPRG